MITNITKTANLARNIILYDELQKMLSSFNKNNIPAIVMKGAALAETVYPNIGQRPMTDIDLLINIEDLPLIEKELLKSGYKKDENVLLPHYTKKISEYNFIFLDLHYELWFLNEKYLREIWQNAVPARIADTEVLMMNPSDTIIHLAVHCVVDHGNIKKVYIDDAEKMINHCNDSMNWSLLLEKVENYDVQIPVYAFLTKLNQEKKCVPLNILEQLKPKYHRRFRELMFLKILNRKAEHIPDEIGYFLVPLSANKMKNKIIRLLKGIFPSKKLLKYRYSFNNSLMVYMFYLKRAVLLCVKGIKTAFKIIISS